MEKQAESPTTARPIDFDDEQQESGVIAKDSTETPTKPPRSSSLRPERNVRFEESDDVPPPKPPRSTSPNTEAVSTLKEAFPGTDAKVIRAVLMASGGQVEPAFNALLAMSDPDFHEELPPAQPARPSQQRRQEEQDEAYARQLAQHYQTQAQQPPGGHRPQPVGRDGRPRLNEEDREYSFFDDDLPEIRDQISKGFRDTQKTINKWVTNFRKTIDGEPDSDDEDYRPSSSSQQPPRRQNFGPKQSDQLRGIRREAGQMNSAGRRSTDQERYDADPRVLSDNFTELELHDAEHPPPKPARPSANPDLFKPTPALPYGPIDEVAALYEQPTPAGKNAGRSVSPNSQIGPNASTPASGKSKKWQPLTSVAPAPVADNDGDDDPFKLNSDDEEDENPAKDEDLRKEDTQRLKAAADKVKQGADAQDGKKELQEHERSGSVGTRDKAAEELLSGGGGGDEKK